MIQAFLSGWQQDGRLGLTLVALTLVLVLGATVSADAGELTTDWSLTDLYPNLEAWNAAKEAVPAVITELEQYEGTLNQGPDKLLAVLELSHKAQKQASRLFTYANMTSDLDLRKPGPMGMRQELRQMYTELSAKVAWIDPEILTLPSETIEKYLAAEPGLAPYARYLERLEKQRPHMLDAKSEELLSMTGFLTGDGTTIGSILRDAEIPWQTITLSDGTEIKVDSIGYSRGRAKANREDRIKTYDAFYGTLTGFQQSLATTLSATVKSHVFTTRVRSYSDTLEASLSGAEVDPAVFNMLIDEVNNALPTLHRYLKIRGRMLGIDDLRYHDLYPSLVGSVAAEYPWPEAVEEVLTAFAPMGEDYVSYLRNACENGWIDVFPREGKRSGAYVTGGAYDVHPYMLLNHQDSYDTTSTFAHEAGHLMHSGYSNKEQPYPIAGYETFVAEVASTTQEWLFFKHSIAKAASDDEKLAILGNFLESFRTTVFRQTMFAEFERSMHKLVENGRPITSETLNELYFDILKRYHGHEEGVCTIDEKYQVEWAFIPHFHFNYYVYSYATSFIAGTAFHDQILTGENGGVERYIDNLLKAGGTKPPVEILQSAGVDMTTAAPFQAAFKAMEEPVGSLVGTRPLADAAPPAPLVSYVGQYANGFWGPARVTDRDGGLQLALGPKLTAP
ncbi:MAG: oligoendopeptidase F, partial [bacterium]|nr:oligoendopeptidase F [bacterium]